MGLANIYSSESNDNKCSTLYRSAMAFKRQFEGNIYATLRTTSVTRFGEFFANLAKF